MDISRNGARRNHGSKPLISELSFGANQDSFNSNVEWAPGLKELLIHAQAIPHEDGRTHHNYTIRLTLEDISSLISVLGHAGADSDAKLLRRHLKKHVPAIVKLLVCATGTGSIKSKAIAGQGDPFT